ncbi:flippase [Haloarcula amylolytica]|uniref:flippase n=1 Tax=Haloarcula amylolytica TaxID=396317 RepID=UPI003C74EFB1
MTDTNQTIIRKSTLILLGNILGMGSTFFLHILLANTYNTSIYGIMVLSITTVNLVSIFFLLGFPRAIAREGAIHTNHDQLFSATALMSITTAVVGTMLVLFGLDSITTFLGIQKHSIIYGTFLAAIPFVVLVELGDGLFQALEWPPGRVITKNFLMKFTPVLLAAFAYLSGIDHHLFSIFWVMIMILSAITTIMVMRWKAGKIFTRDLNWTLTRRLFVFSVPLLLSDAVWILIQQIDNYVITYFSGSSSVGVYSSAFTLAKVLELAPASASFIILPLLSKEFESNNSKRWNAIYESSTKWMAILSFPLVLLMISFPTRLINVFYSEEYLTAGGVLPIIAIGFFTHTIFGVNKGGLIAIGRTRIVLYSGLIVLLLNTALNIALVPQFGIVGAAVASVLTYLVMNIILYYYLFREMGASIFSKSMTLPLIVGFGIWFALSLYIPNWQAYSISILAFSIVTLMKSVSKFELEAIREII